MKLTEYEIRKLDELNAQRDPIQAKFVEEAERLFDIWHELNRDKHLSFAIFQTASLRNNAVFIEYEASCGCGHGDEQRVVTLPLKAMLNSAWEDDATRTIVSRDRKKRQQEAAETERQERAQQAALNAKYPR